jgi:hypothetical protein
MMHAVATELNWSLEVYFGDKEYFGGQRFWPAESWGRSPNLQLVADLQYGGESLFCI